MSISAVELAFICSGLIIFELALVTVCAVLKNKLNADKFRRFCSIFLIGWLCSAIPLGPISMILGLPAVLLASFFTALLLDNDLLTKNKKEKGDSVG